VEHVQRGSQSMLASSSCTACFLQPAINVSYRIVSRWSYVAAAAWLSVSVHGLGSARLGWAGLDACVRACAYVARAGGVVSVRQQSQSDVH